MQEVIILQGIPASGKSTWAREFIKNKSDNWIIVNRDSIRNMCGEYWIPSREHLITSIERTSIIEGLVKGFNIILDATNFNAEHLNALQEHIKSEVDKEIKYTYKKFDISLEEAIKRDSKRENPVGEKVIKNFYYKYVEKPSYIKIDNRFILKQDKTLPSCIICDLDGTLALINGRSPYDMEKIYTDKVNTPVKDLIEDYAIEMGIQIIYVSGRSEKGREATLQWMRDMGIYYDCKNCENPCIEKSCTHDLLYMRKEGDNRKDSIIKKEIYEEYIKDKYYVRFVLDDRNQTVKQWREIGLLCLQVYDGDF